MLCSNSNQIYDWMTFSEWNSSICNDDFLFRKFPRHDHVCILNECVPCFWLPMKWRRHTQKSQKNKQTSKQTSRIKHISKSRLIYFLAGKHEPLNRKCTWLPDNCYNDKNDHTAISMKSKHRVTRDWFAAIFLQFHWILGQKSIRKIMKKMLKSNQDFIIES